MAGQMYDTAMVLAQAAHLGQTRKRSGEPYINHCVRVASSVNNDPAALLHDAIEDAKNPEEMAGLIEWHFGEDVAKILEALTKRKGEDYLTYILRVHAGGSRAISIKLADLADNMRDLEPGTKRDKYLLAEYILKGASG